MRSMAIFSPCPNLQRIAAILVVVSLAMPAVVGAQDTPVSRATLKGIKAVEVLVGDIDRDTEQEGLTRAHLQTEVEERLRQAGITVSPSSEGVLYVSVVAARGDLSIYAYSLQVAFRQAVTLTRDPTIGAVVTTWSVGSGGTIAAPRLGRVQSLAINLVDQFIHAYLEENPKI